MSEEIIKLIEKFLSHSISEEEKEKLFHAYHQEQISEEQFDRYYAAKWKRAGQHTSSFADESKERTWQKLRMHMRAPSKALPRRRNSWVSYASVAAVAILFFILGISLQPAGVHPGKELVVTVENGQKASIQLPDGSHVRLNSASELRYSPDFGEKNRTVKLVGEAYFDVESDPDNPFVVLAHDDLQVKALGTRFNIKSYPNDQQVTGTLLEGRIEVSNELSTEILAPHDQVMYHIREKTFRRSRVDNAEEAIFWMTDQFVFDKERLEDIAKMLERTYNVTIAFSTPGIKEIQYSGKIKNNSMENVLSLITTVSPLQYTMIESHIVFSEK